MNKRFEYVDDNPGSYFGMLVENWENLNEDKKNLRNWIEKKVGKQMSNMKPTKIGYRHGRPYYSVDFVDGTSDDYFIDFDKKEIEKCESLKEQKEVTRDEKIKAISSNPEARKMAQKLTDQGELSLDAIISFVYADFFGKEESLKEDKNELSIVGEFETGENFGQSAGTSKKNQAIFRAKALMKMKGLSSAKVINAKGNVVWDSDTMLKEDKFVSRDKMSKKDKKELDSQKRNTWGNTNPVTRVQANKKAYDRKRDSKVIEEAKQLNEVRDFEWGQELWAVVKDNGDFAGNPCLSWEEAREISANHEGSKIYEMSLDRDQINESVSKKDLYDALKDAYGMTKKEADKWIKDASEKSKEEIVKGFKSNAKKSFKYD